MELEVIIDITKIYNQMMKKLYAGSVNKLVEEANRLELTKDNIVSIVSVSNGYVLIYFD
jgi:hypothetical protein